MALAEYHFFGLFINSPGNILSAYSFGKLHLLASCFCLAVVYVLLKAICSGFMQVRTALPWQHRSPKTGSQLQCSWTLTRRKNCVEKLMLTEFKKKRKEKKKKQNRLWWWGYFSWLERDLVWGICWVQADFSHLAIKYHRCEWEGAKMTARASWWGEVPAPDKKAWKSEENHKEPHNLAEREPSLLHDPRDPCAGLTPWCPHSGMRQKYSCLIRVIMLQESHNLPS